MISTIRNILVVVSFLAVGSVAYAQGGIKLGGGDSDAEASKLDLGASKPAQAAASAPVGQAKTKTVGAWEVACSPQGDNCAMAQIGNDSTGTPVLEIVIRKLAEPLEADGRTAIAVLDVITPLGVVLTTGLALKIDDGPAEAAPFQVCTEQGCLVREPIDDGLISRLKKGSNAVLSVVAASQGEVSANISLSGFTKAYGSLR